MKVADKAKGVQQIESLFKGQVKRIPLNPGGSIGASELPLLYHLGVVLRSDESGGQSERCTANRKSLQRAGETHPPEPRRLHWSKRTSPPLSSRRCTPI